tara:strand:- start:27 stop:203 length:177 start_codon:yes stop_codon:yes gene_type:complete
MLNEAVTGNAAPAHLDNCSCVVLPSTIHGGRSTCGISASLHVIDVRNWQAPEENNEVA